MSATAFLFVDDASFGKEYVTNNSHDYLLYVNDLSDRWIFAYISMVCEEDGAYATLVKKHGPFTESSDFTNNPADYRKTEVRFDKTLADDPESGLDFIAFFTWQGLEWGESIESKKPGGYRMGDVVPVYDNAKASDLSVDQGIDMMFHPGIITDKLSTAWRRWPSDGERRQGYPPYISGRRRGGRCECNRDIGRWHRISVGSGK